MNKPYRNLVREVAYAEYAVRDSNSMLGLLWSFLNPLLMMAVLFAYFRMNAGRGVNHYAIFLLLGMIHYTHFSNSTSAAMNVLIVSSQLTRNTILPKEVMVIGSVLATSVEFVVSMVVCVVLAPFTGIPVTWAILGLPLIVFLQLVFVMWVSFLLSSARVFVKDLAHVYQVMLRLLFFATPIFYATQFLENSAGQATGSPESAGRNHRTFAQLRDRWANTFRRAFSSHWWRCIPSRFGWHFAGSNAASRALPNMSERDCVIRMKNVTKLFPSGVRQRSLFRMMMGKVSAAVGAGDVRCPAFHQSGGQTQRPVGGDRR